MFLFSFVVTAQTISLANLPLYFEANPNQTEFLSSGNGYQFTISASGVQMSLRESSARAATARMRLAGANPAAQIHGGDEMRGKVNYLIGNDPGKWQTGLATFGNVLVTELYPGINMVFHGNQRQLEYDFKIAPGANPNAIKMQFDGVDKISLSPQGDLVLKIANHEIRQPKPEIYQTIDGARKTIAGGFKILNSRTVAFEVAQFDRSLPLVIDPVLGYSAFFGGNVSDTPTAIAMDVNNNVYITGETLSKQFSTVGAAQTNFNGGSINGDAFIAKFSGSPPTNLIYLTYLGGSSDDLAYGIAADSAGNAFVTGYTISQNFPTNHAIFPKFPGAYSSRYGTYFGSGFVTELNTNGTNLIYSTYLGGAALNSGESIAVDSSDNAYVVGYTCSTNFPVTANALQKHLACTNTLFLNPNGFLTEIASNDASLVYSTFLGGTNYDFAACVAVDASNYVYVAGYTASTNFPTWNVPTNLIGARLLNNITNANFSTPFDAFVTKFPPLTNQPSSVADLVYSTFLGGTNNDMAYGIAADASGNAYVTGWTTSTNFPVINPPPGLSSFVTTNGRSGVATNVFLTKIAPDGSSANNSVVFGGNLADIGYKVAVDSGGDAFVVGTETSYTNFPTKNAFGSLLATNSSGTGAHDAFVTGISADWSTVFYSVCIGGNRDSSGFDIVLDSSTNAFITGDTDSTNYPTFNAGRYWFDGTNVINGTNYIDGTRFTGTNDAFLTEITFAPSAVINVSGIEPPGETNGMGATVTFAVTTTGASGQVLYQWQKNGTNLVNGGRISGANSPTVTITNSQPGDSSTNYGLTISYPGTIISPEATNSDSLTQSDIDLTVSEAPVITLLPTNQTVFVGTNVSFSVVASGAPLFYEWVFNDAMILTNNSQISGATNDTLMINDVQTNNAGAYRLFVYYNNTNYFVTNVTLAVVEPGITIISAPTNQTVGAGSAVSFTVVASGYPLSYQWQTNGVNLVNGTNISGATSSTLTLTNVQTWQAGTYTVIVTNQLQGTNLSATLTVTPATSAVFTGFAPAAGGLGNGLVLSGTGGTTNGTYYVLTSSNLLTPTTNWTFISTQRFDSQGRFVFTNPVSTNDASQFFMLKQP
ncbi:MAG TPA: SBBP repeat-containing protein [Verrucomicrobiae bacterium]|nr:SBBP repeat-containing protein [Verrucomicrobiae bacterium]